MTKTTWTMAAAAFSLAASGVLAQDTFDACEVFTQAEAQKAVGSKVEAEPVNPRAKRPKVISACTWIYTKDGKPASVSVNFRFGRSEADAQRAFDEEKLKYQTKPMLIGGASGFWSAKLGTLQLLKGRTWVVIAAGGDKPADRDAEASRRIADILAPRL